MQLAVFTIHVIFAKTSHIELRNKTLPQILTSTFSPSKPSFLHMLSMQTRVSQSGGKACEACGTALSNSYELASALLIRLTGPNHGRPMCGLKIDDAHVI